VIDQKDMRLTLRQPVLDAGIVKDIAWEKRKFNPKGKSLWIRETIIPISGLPLAQNNQANEGRYVLDIFVVANTGTELLEDTITQIAKLYNPDDVPFLRGSNTMITIQECSRKTNLDDGMWTFGTLSILFKAFDSIN